MNPKHLIKLFELPDMCIYKNVDVALHVRVGKYNDVEEVKYQNFIETLSIYQAFINNDQILYLFQRIGDSSVYYISAVTEGDITDYIIFRMS